MTFSTFSKTFSSRMGINSTPGQDETVDKSFCSVIFVLWNEKLVRKITYCCMANLKNC